MKHLLLLSCACLMLMVACKKEESDDKNTTTTTSTTSTTSTTTPAPKDTVEELIEIKTAFGTMYMWLYKETPQHRDNFLKLANEHYFDSTTFHRCVKSFVIQGGDPNSKDTDSTNDGSGGPGYTIPAEIDTALFKHKRGAVGAARTNNPEKASNGSQFYIVLPKAGTKNLDNNYTVFGEIIGGMEAADKIVLQPQNAQNNRPYTDIRMGVTVIKLTRKQLRDDFNFTPTK